MNNLTNCPNCNAELSNYEQKERECFGCGWSQYAAPNDTIKTRPQNFEFDREIDDETMD
jgi:Zn ribbon nucleic-acid-binding protein